MDIFVARQPIFNRQQEVYAYELLYRSGINKFYSSLDGDQASSEVITNSFLLIGLETLTRGKRPSSILLKFAGRRSGHSFTS